MPDIRTDLSQWMLVVEQMVLSGAGVAGVQTEVGPWLRDNLPGLQREWGRLRATGFADMEPLLQRVRAASREEGCTTLWCVRWHQPATALMLLFCRETGARLGRWMDGFIQQRELAALEAFCGELASGRLRLAPARNGAEFAEALRQAAAVGGRVRVFCDWRLDGEEWAAARALAVEGGLCLDDLGVGPDLAL
jgi:hypothetical protein